MTTVDRVVAMNTAWSFEKRTSNNNLMIYSDLTVSFSDMPSGGRARAELSDQTPLGSVGAIPVIIFGR
jgi:hypothetical protein